MTTLTQLLQQTSARFKTVSMPTPALDARLLIQAACAVSAEDMVAYRDRVVTPDQLKLMERYVGRRLAGEPVSRIVGKKEFWGMEIAVTPDTLDPRPDTETLVEAALGWARGGPLKILDLGTGTGCILLSLLKELPQATGIGVDISPGAIATAQNNASRNGVEGRADFRLGSWFEPLKIGESFDLIVSNPPYIAESQMKTLAPEVLNHDPRTALTDEKDGFEAYRTIYPQLKRWLKPGGMAFFEMGFDQSVHMQRLVADSGATLEGVYKDLAGHERVIGLSIP